MEETDDTKNVDAFRWIGFPTLLDDRDESAFRKTEILFVNVLSLPRKDFGSDRVSVANFLKDDSARQLP